MNQKRTFHHAHQFIQREVFLFVHNVSLCVLDWRTSSWCCGETMWVSALFSSHGNLLHVISSSLWEENNKTLWVAELYKIESEKGGTGQDRLYCPSGTFIFLDHSWWLVAAQCDFCPNCCWTEKNLASTQTLSQAPKTKAQQNKIYKNILTTTVFGFCFQQSIV